MKKSITLIAILILSTLSSFSQTKGKIDEGKIKVDQETIKGGVTKTPACGETIEVTIINGGSKTIIKDIVKKEKLTEEDKILIKEEKEIIEGETKGEVKEPIAGENPITKSPITSNPAYSICGNMGLAIGNQIPLAETAHDDFKLAVDGKIVAKHVVVTAENWADFVFENGYQLQPLSEVALFIENNGHLPNVPSEKEVSDNGVNLAEMDAILLRKIEELTLYVIELKNENTELKQAVKELQGK